MEDHSVAKNSAPNPDKIGIGKFWAWQTRGASGAINFIILSFLAIYCTDALGMPANITGMLLLASKVIDAVTDLFAGYLQAWQRQTL
jgi:Na+/melibiose symporter-like transporter